MKNNKPLYDLNPLLARNDRKAAIVIWTISVIVFIAVAMLSRFKVNVELPFNPHLFAKANAIINSIVTVLLIAAFIAVKQRNYSLHKKLMLAAIILSLLFLLSYICHHLFAGETKYGGEGSLKIIYYIVLATHIPLAGIILPFILFTAYRSLSGDYPRHKKLSKITFPIWLYVAITGVLVYILINPYYS
jgi:putative membrane protein